MLSAELVAAVLLSEVVADELVVETTVEVGMENADGRVVVVMEVTESISVVVVKDVDILDKLPDSVVVITVTTVDID